MLTIYVEIDREEMEYVYGNLGFNAAEKFVWTGTGIVVGRILDSIIGLIQKIKFHTDSIFKVNSLNS